MNFKKTMLASLLMISASGAFAADTATLAVKGTIAPTACNVTINGGANSTLTFDVADYIGVEKTLDPQDIQFDISCDPNAIAVSLKLTDERVSSAHYTGSSFGLGMHGDNKIGGYKMDVTNLMADSSPARLLWRTVGQPVWELAPGSNMSSGATYEFSFGGMTSLDPVLANNITTTISVTPTINASLPVGDAVSLDGSVSFTISMI